MQDCSARLQAAKEDADAKTVEIVAELDKFRRAFAGDPLGWSAATDEDGKPYYYNSETGEKSMVSLVSSLPLCLFLCFSESNVLTGNGADSGA